MKFKDLLYKLQEGETFEQIASNYYKEKYNDFCNVECIKNEVYEDEDLYEFLNEVEAEIIDYDIEYVIIETNDKTYKIPYKEKTNRFGDDLPNETILIFDINKISEEIGG